MVLLATQTPLTRVLNGPHPKRTCVTMPSGCGIGAGVIACAEVARAKKPATAINLIIFSSLVTVLFPSTKEEISQDKSHYNSTFSFTGSIAAVALI